ncbi:MAG: ribose 5-phosphate isomerase B [Pirellulaceae bacterium]|jgi:ribose 5-phosphate isomerase B
MRVSIGSDHRGYHVKEKLIQFLTQLGHEVADEGTHESQSVDYPAIASKVSSKVSDGSVDRGILICGTGIGMAITANKFKRVRAATCYDEVTAEMSRRHNDVNVLCLSGDMLGERRIDRMVQIWMDTEFEGGRHARRIESISEIEAAGGACGTAEGGGCG